MRSLEVLGVECTELYFTVKKKDCIIQLKLWTNISNHLLPWPSVFPPITSLHTLSAPQSLLLSMLNSWTVLYSSFLLLFKWPTLALVNSFFRHNRFSKADERERGWWWWWRSGITSLSYPDAFVLTTYLKWFTLFLCYLFHKTMYESKYKLIMVPDVAHHRLVSGTISISKFFT